MSKQHNKAEKRQRRVRYLKRKKKGDKAKIKTSAGTAAAPAA